MLIWIAFAVMTGLAILAIVVPLARGIIGESEAEAARTEISRRLLVTGERRDREAALVQIEQAAKTLGLAG